MWRDKLERIIAVIAIGMVLYHLISTQFLLVGPLEHQNIHLAFSLLLVFLTTLQRSRKRSVMLLLLIACAASLVATGYVQFFYHELLSRQGFPTVSDLIIGVILIIVSIEATRQAFKIVLPIVALLGIIYAFFGYLIPGPLRTMHFAPEKIIANFSQLMGIYDSALAISANYLFLFVTFGAVLQVTEVGRFFDQVGKFIGRKLSGGAALTAVVSSGLLGMLMGSVGANIATSGAYTIPLMKKSGYTPEQAGAIEAAASTGGQYMPPIMGATAFLIVAFTDIPYFRIVRAAAIPAIIYFLVVGLYAQLQAMKLHLHAPAEKVNYKELLLGSPLFIIPVGIIILMLTMRYSPMYSIFWAIISISIIAQFRKKTRPSLRQWIVGVTNGARLGAQIGVSCALIGLIITSASSTGLGIKLPSLVEIWSGGHLAVALVITMVTGLILGCGMPTIGVYVIVATVSAPVLVKMGLSLLQTHLFIFWVSVLNFVTPPVAIGALIASKMAGGNFLKTAVESTKAALGGFVIPFLFILCPVLILEPQESGVITGVIASLFIFTSLQLALSNHFIMVLSLAERGFLFAVVAAFLAHLIVKNHLLFAFGIFAFALVTIWQFRKRALSHGS